MNKRRFALIIGMAGLAVVAVLNMPAAWSAGATHGRHSGDAAMNMPKKAAPPKVSIERIHSAYLPAVSASVDVALKKLVSKDTDGAILELQRTKKVIAATKMALAKHVKPEFANVKCPIMGSPIKPERVSKSLIREYKDKKVAFCCGGCPKAWDELTDAQKEAKLTKVKPDAESKMNGHQGMH